MKMIFRVPLWSVALCLLLASQAGAQPTAEELASNPPLFLQTARTLRHWDEPADPAKIVGPIYFVGTKGLGVFLITTPAGHILVNTGMPGSGRMIAESIRKLGFNPEDVKILLLGHAHCDHAGGHADLKRMSGARIAVIGEEKDVFESGGKLDFHYGDYPEFAFEGTTVDQVFQDGDTITLGDISIKCLLTPGHTKGSTTFVTKIVDQGTEYSVVFPNGTSINPGYRVTKNPSYEGISDDYRRTLRVLADLKPDIWLAAHNEVYDYEGKLARSAKEGAQAWVDPAGYQKWVVAQRENLEAVIARETTGKK